MGFLQTRVEYIPIMGKYLLLCYVILFPIPDTTHSSIFIMLCADDINSSCQILL